MSARSRVALGLGQCLLGLCFRETLCDIVTGLGCESGLCSIQHTFRTEAAGTVMLVLF